MSKLVKSTDPRKAELIKAFKGLTGATKVTNVKEVDDGKFTANCFKYEGNNGRKYTDLGTHELTFVFNAPLVGNTDVTETTETESVSEGTIPAA